MTARPVHVLLVEDNAVDREAIRRAFAHHRIDNPVHDAVDGIEALEILRGENGREKLRRPYLLLLDINLPRMNGLELLNEIRRDDEHKDAIVFVLTTSRSEEDKAAAYDAHVAGYMVKQHVGGGFAGIASLLDRYFQVVELPEHRRG